MGEGQHNYDYSTFFIESATSTKSCSVRGGGKKRDTTLGATLWRLKASTVACTERCKNRECE